MTCDGFCEDDYDPTFQKFCDISLKESNKIIIEQDSYMFTISKKPEHVWFSICSFPNVLAELLVLCKLEGESMKLYINEWTVLINCVIVPNYNNVWKLTKEII